MDYPAGCETFPEAIRWLESKSFPSTDDLGEKAPACWDGAWLAAEELYRFASCHDTCPGRREDHTIRMLVGRTANEAISALDCLERGNYDAALIICRVLLEQHNILTLLLHDKKALESFKRSDPSELRQELAPLHVRRKLRELGLEDIVVREISRLSSELSTRAIHPALEQLAASHIPGHVVVGPIWQPAGFLLALNELAFAEIAILRMLTIVSPFEGEAVGRVSAAIHRVTDGLGGVRINHLPEELRHNIPEDRWLDGSS